VVVLRSLLRVGFCSGGQVSSPQIRYCGYTRNVIGNHRGQSSVIGRRENN
jgi:hypothetical protein